MNSLNISDSGFDLHTPTPIAKYIPGLDGMRALALAVVILGHSGFLKAPSAFGVTAFFFISGFLITNLLITEYASSGRFDLGAFYMRRYFRLMPELVGYLATGLVFSYFLGKVPGTFNILGAIFYFTNYIKAFDVSGETLPFVFGHLWSLAVEEHFYIIWPFLLTFLMPGHRRPITALATILVVCLVWKIAISTLGILPTHYIEYATDTRFDSIAYGCLCAFIFRYYPTIFNSSRQLRWAALILGACLLLIPMAGRSLFGSETLFQSAGRYSIQGIGFIMVFYYLYSTKSNFAVNVLERPALRFIGRSSYGAYIWHYALIYGFSQVVGFRKPEDLPILYQCLCFSFAMIAAVAMGHISARVFLSPFAPIRRRFGSVAIEHKAG